MAPLHGTSDSDCELAGEQLVAAGERRKRSSLTFATTYDHNLTRTDRPLRFEHAALNGHISASALPEFRDFLNREGQAFLERIDAWLTDHQADAREQDSAQVPIRLGAHIPDPGLTAGCSGAQRHR